MNRDSMARMSRDEAVLYLRSDPKSRELVHDAYFGPDVLANAHRFLKSAEFKEIRRVLGDVQGLDVIDLGAGTGIASYAFAHSGVRQVLAVEPNPSAIVGLGAMKPLLSRAKIKLIATSGEELPFEDGSTDIIYARAVLHHVTNLSALVTECSRVMRKGAAFLATREHVVDNQRHLEEFLKNHPINYLTHDEGAHTLDEYLQAIKSAGLVVKHVWGPFDSIINAYPLIRSQEMLSNIHNDLLSRKLGSLGKAIASFPGAGRAVTAWLNRPRPGRLFSFFAVKP